MRQVLTDFVTACVQHAQEQQPHASATAVAAHDSSSVQQPVCQVVSLGAGSDSSWFCLQQQGWALLPSVHYMELDYQEVRGSLGREYVRAQPITVTRQLYARKSLSLHVQGCIAAAPAAVSIEVLPTPANCIHMVFVCDVTQAAMQHLFRVAELP
jgi:hypothetical protein